MKHAQPVDDNNVVAATLAFLLSLGGADAAAVPIAVLLAPLEDISYNYNLFRS